MHLWCQKRSEDFFNFLKIILFQKEEMLLSTFLDAPISVQVFFQYFFKDKN